MKTTNETGFWDSLQKMLNPQWQALDVPGGQSNSLISERTVHIYFADTAARSVSCASFSPHEMQQLLRLVESTADAQKQAVQLIARLASSEDCQDLVMRLRASALYILTTQTYRAVMEMTNKIDGHWLVLVYRPQDGSTPILRPAYGKSTKLGHMPASSLEQWIGEVIAMDLSNAKSMINQQIYAHGGPVLSEKYLAAIA